MFSYKPIYLHANQLAYNARLPKHRFNYNAYLPTRIVYTRTCLNTYTYAHVYFFTRRNYLHMHRIYLYMQYVSTRHTYLQASLFSRKPTGIYTYTRNTYIYLLTSGDTDLQHTPTYKHTYLHAYMLTCTYMHAHV